MHNIEIPIPTQEETVIQIPLLELHPFPNHPFKVRDDDAMATIVMVDTNLQRENISPMEKAQAYNYK